MKKRTSYEVIAEYTCERIRSALLNVPERVRCRACEIRLRVDRPVTIVCPDAVYGITGGGKVTQDLSSPELLCADMGDIKSAVEKMCRYSVYSCQKEFREGYFILETGVRAGIGGTVTQTEPPVYTDVNSINFRVAREVNGCAAELTELIGVGSSVLICGEVNSGKTTILRDYCRLCGSSLRTALIDERGEIAAVRNGIPSNDVGIMTDIITGSERCNGMISALRTLSPQLIVCDEISAESDVTALLSVHGSGVRIAATIHAADRNDLLNRSVAQKLIRAGCFEYAAFLVGCTAPSKISSVVRVDELC